MHSFKVDNCIVIHYSIHMNATNLQLIIIVPTTDLITFYTVQSRCRLMMKFAHLKWKQISKNINVRIRGIINHDTHIH